MQVKEVQVNNYFKLVVNQDKSSFATIEKSVVAYLKYVIDLLLNFFLQIKISSTLSCEKP